MALQYNGSLLEAYEIGALSFDAEQLEEWPLKDDEQLDESVTGMEA